LTQNGVLCANVLASKHRELSGIFGKRGVEPSDRFAKAVWRVLTTGAPVLSDAAVNLDCRITQTQEMGTHSIFFCEVVGIAMARDPDGLIYFNRAYHNIRPARSAG